MLRAWLAAFLTLTGLTVACGDDTSTGGGAPQGGGGSLPAGGASAGGAGGGAAGGAAQGGAAQGGAGGAGAMGFSSLGSSAFETQATLAADPTGSVVAAWTAVFMDGHSAIGYAISRDGGLSWSAAAYADAPAGRLSSSPVMTVDGRGIFTLAWIGFRLDAMAPDEHVYAAQLGASDDAFGAPALVSDDGSATNLDYDSVAIAVDGDDQVLFTWANFTGAGQGFLPQLLFARSGDLVSFERTAIVSDASFGNLPALCVDTGTNAAPVYVVHLGAGGTLTARKSDDHGATWTLLPATSAAAAVFQRPSCVAVGDTLRVAYASGDAPFSPTDDAPGDAVEIVTSSNQGATWGAPVVVTEVGPDQYLFPKLSRSPSNKLEIAYYQGQPGLDATLMHASSSNGTSWSRAPIAPAGTFTTDIVLASWLGGQIGASVPGGNAFMAWAENSQNVTHIAFAEVALP